MLDEKEKENRVMHIVKLKPLGVPWLHMEVLGSCYCLFAPSSTDEPPSWCLQYMLDEKEKENRVMHIVKLKPLGVPWLHMEVLGSCYCLFAPSSTDEPPSWCLQYMLDERQIE